MKLPQGRVQGLEWRANRFHATEMQMGANNADGVIIGGIDPDAAALANSRDGRAGGLANMYPNMP